MNIFQRSTVALPTNSRTEISQILFRIESVHGLVISMMRNKLISFIRILRTTYSECTKTVQWEDSWQMWYKCWIYGFSVLTQSINNWTVNVLNCLHCICLILKANFESEITSHSMRRKVVTLNHTTKATNAHHVCWHQFTFIPLVRWFTYLNWC